jgi:hypothetical protein
LVDQRLGSGCLEVRTMSALLSAGAGYLERTILSPTQMDHDPTSPGGDALPMRGL